MADLDPDHPMRFNPHIVAASAAALLLASCALGKKSDGSPKGEGGAKGGSDGAGGKGGSSGNPSRGGAGGSMLTSGRAGAGGAAGGSSPSGGAGGATWPSADAGVPIYDAGSVDAGGSVDSGASRADGPAGSARDAYVPCTVSITPESPPTLTNLVPGDTARLSVRGTIAWGSTSPVQPNWQWTVTGPDSTKLALSASQLNGPTTVVEFPLLTNGYYEISVSISSSCKGKTTAFAVKPQERIQPYWIRVLPPPSGGAGPAEHCDTGTSHWCPSQDAVPVEAALHLQAGQPASRNFDLLLGTSVVVDPSRTASDKMGLSVAVPAYIRIVSPGSTWRLDGYSNADHQGFSVRLDPSPWVSYSLLIVPQIDDISLSLAPLFVPPTAATALPYLGYQLSSGVTVSGHVRSSSGPGQDARILLRSEDQSTPGIILPSTIGVADSKGAYTLQASPGARYTAFVLAPSGSSLPDAEIPGAVDLSSVDPSQSNAQSGSLLSKLDFEWNSVATTSLIILTATADGTSPGAAVGVRIESDDTSLENAGTLTLPDGSTIPARGKVRREAITDNNGSVTFSDLPRAGYKLTLVPTSNDANAAITNATVDLTGTDSASVRTISLARKVKLSGALLPAAVSAGAKLVATDTGTDVVLSMLSATVASDGSYALMANPKRTYRFFVEPVPGGQLPLRMPVYGVTTTEKDQTLSDRTLSSGLKVTGVVSYQNIPVQGSVVQAFCQQDGLADCVPTNPGNLTSELPRPLAEVATSADGTFTFYLPDPGTGN